MPPKMSVRRLMIGYEGGPTSIEVLVKFLDFKHQGVCTLSLLTTSPKYSTESWKIFKQIPSDSPAPDRLTSDEYVIQVTDHIGKLVSMCAEK